MKKSRMLLTVSMVIALGMTGAACGSAQAQMTAGADTVAESMSETETKVETASVTETKEKAKASETDAPETEMSETETQAPETEKETEAKAEELSFPLTYEDDTLSIEVTREWYADCSWVYCAHVQTSDYARISTYEANNEYGTYCTVSEAAAQLSSILTVNGDYMAPDLGYTFARAGVLYGPDKACYAPGIYSSYTGELHDGWEGSATGGTSFSSLISSKYLTDTFTFGPPILRDSGITCIADGPCRPRTFIGYAGTPGEMYICVADGDYNDGESVGLSAYDCAAFLLDKGCYLGVPLDGGGSSTMVWKGEVINAVKGNEREVVDFLYVK